MKIFSFKVNPKKAVITAVSVSAAVVMLTVFFPKIRLMQISVRDDTASLSLPAAVQNTADTDYIKWVDFKICYPALEKALKADIDSHNTENHVNWIDILAYLGAKYGGEFSRYKASDMTEFLSRIQNGEKTEQITDSMKYFPYYRKAYGAVLEEFVGNYSIETTGSDNPDEHIYSSRYGLKVYSPVAEGYSYSDYDDFGTSRSYGYKRRHLGHDMMGSVGTPIVAVESGTIEVMGWNMYGGWRIGIRSFDKKRYYYYAHLRKDHPFNNTLKEGDTVYAGDVIGYLGMTGYSTKENTNNIDIPHLHIGLELIFDESQKDGANQIWINLYDIMKLLRKHKSSVYKDSDTKEYFRRYAFYESRLNGG